MNKKLAELTVSKSEDYYNKLITVLTDAGFVIVLDFETTTDRHYIVAEEDDEKKSYNTDIENPPATKHWIFERVECNFINHDLWDFKLRCPNCFTASTFSISPFAINTFSEQYKCPVCEESLIFDPEDMFKNEKAN